MRITSAIGAVPSIVTVPLTVLLPMVPPLPLPPPPPPAADPGTTETGATSDRLSQADVTNNITTKTNDQIVRYCIEILLHGKSDDERPAQRRPHPS